MRALAAAGAALGVPVIEDAAQAFGSPGIAQVGVATTFSFFPTKNLPGLGDGGLVATSDAGRNWRRLTTPVTAEAFCFTSPNNGWIALRGSVWRTRDGAAHWERKTLMGNAPGGYPVAELACSGSSVWALFHRGAAASQEGYDVFRSLDGGDRKSTRLNSSH